MTLALRMIGMVQRRRKRVRIQKKGSDTIMMDKMRETGRESENQHENRS